MLLAGDIGGTKTNLAVYSLEKWAGVPLAQATFRSIDYPDLETMAGEFLTRVDLEIEAASFGVAGPVVNDQATITNLPWLITKPRLQDALKISNVHLLNDLVATAAALPRLKPSDLYTLNAGQAEPGGPIALIAPGTGLGEAYLTWDGTRYHPFPSEGGHVDFAPTKPLELELLQYLQDRMDHVSYEHVCSGTGLPNIYAFLKDMQYAEEPSWLADQLVQTEDPTPVIVKAAQDLDRRCDLCTLTINTFVAILGSEAGNLALKVLSTGGVYLGGGIPARILSFLENGQFMPAFQRKGRLSDILSQMPVHVILNPKAALLGAACYGLERLHN
jgi:glucokinase